MLIISSLDGMKKRATLRDIAKALNVSITTVSRALNDKEDISPDTKKTVVEVARMLNYKPNSLAVSLRKKSASRLIGVILPSVDHYFYSTILNGIMNASKEKETLVIIGESGHDAEKEKQIIDMYIDYYVSGIIMAPTREYNSHLNFQEITRHGVPLVLIDRTFKDYTGSFVQYDDYRGGYIAVEHLALQGKRRIALLRGDQECAVSSERFRGYKEALASFDLPFDENLIRHNKSTDLNDGYNMMKDLLTKNTSMPPDALFTVNDDLAAGAYQAIFEKGLDIPADISIVGYSNSLISTILSPKLSTVEQNGRDLGHTALSILADSIANPNKIVQKTYGAHLIIRDSSQNQPVKS